MWAATPLRLPTPELRERVIGGPAPTLFEVRGNLAVPDEEETSGHRSGLSVPPTLARAPPQKAASGTARLALGLVAAMRLVSRVHATVLVARWSSQAAATPVRTSAAPRRPQPRRRPRSITGCS